MQYPKQTDNYDVDIFNSNFRDLASQILSLDTAKLDKTDAQGLFRDVSFNRNNGTIVFTLYDGSVKTIDTLLEKLAVNFDFDRETQRLIVTLDDGTEKYVDLSAFVSQYEFTDSDTAVWVLGDSGEVSVKIREGSIEEKHLRPDYLADLRAEAEKALASSREAAESQRSAEESGPSQGQRPPQKAQGMQRPRQGQPSGQKRRRWRPPRPHGILRTVHRAMQWAREAPARMSPPKAQSTIMSRAG